MAAGGQASENHLPLDECVNLLPAARGWPACSADAAPRSDPASPANRHSNNFIEVEERALVRPHPAVTKENAFFWTAGAEGVLRFKRCTECTLYVHPPQPRCPRCLSEAIDIGEVSGKAIVATYTVNHHQWHPDLPPPYAIAIVEIAEAPYVRLTARIVNCAVEDVVIGMPVTVLFEQVGPAWIPMFQPEGC
jgi:uncharacterized OB-fold protein